MPLTMTTKRRLVTTALLAPASVWLFVFLVLPFIAMVVFSVGERGPAGGYQAAFTFAQYANLPARSAAYWNTLLLAPVGAFLCLLVAYPTAYYLAVKANPRYRLLLVSLVVVPFWTSLLVRTYAWILLLRNGGLVDAGLQGVGLTEQPLGLLYTDTAVIIGLLYCFLPFMVLPIYTSLEKLDWRLVEAAFDLGANRFQALKRIIIPLSMPGIIAGVMLVFIPSLGNYIIPELLGGGKSLMIGNLIQLQFGSSHNWPFGAALAFALLSLVLLAMLSYSLRFKANAASVQV